NLKQQDKLSEQIKIDAAKACRERLKNNNIDLNAYHTAAIAADVEDLRRTLGIKQWHLYGASYGTKIALRVIADFPSGIASAVLDSVLPPNIRYDEENVANLLLVLKTMFDDCDQSTACKKAFPNLQQRFSSALDRIDSEPVTIKLNNDSRAMISMDRLKLLSLFDFSSPSSIKRMPLLANAIANRDTKLLAQATRMPLGGSRYSWGMRLSVWCSEEIPFVQNKIMDTIAKSTIQYVVEPSVCDAWHVDSRPESEIASVTSDIPVLLISGQYDSVTPSTWAYKAAKTLTNSKVVVIKGGGHAPMQDWSGDGCAMKIATQFINDSSSLIETNRTLPSCINQLSAPVFTTKLP
ncbi:MAG: alpha/beta hydrolase, partial [Kangiellaceae bacterium]|nr:alpha/beta hydrolase [Kangiellaceae bacterium]